MSRWVDVFEQSAFYKAFNELKKCADEDFSGDGDLDHLKEIARLKKVVTFLDDLLISIDPELLSLNPFAVIETHVHNCCSEINAYKQNRNIVNIQNANKYLDFLLNAISPHVVNRKDAARAAGSALRKYSKTVDEELKILNVNTNNIVQKIKDNKTQTDTLLKKTNAVYEKIKASEKELLISTEQRRSISDKIKDLNSDALSYHKEVEDFHKKLTSGGAEDPSIIFEIEQARKNILENKDIIKNFSDSSKEIVNDFKQFYEKIFGIKSKDGEYTGGLKQELEARKKDLETFKQEQKKSYTTIRQEIETLLPGATSAGLATAYKDLKNSFNKSIKTSTIIFYLSLLLIFAIATVFSTSEIGWFWIKFINPTEPAELLNNIAYKLPMLLPALWLAIASSRRRSEDKRLQQEYAHKEALAKSYQSFKQQIDVIKDKDSDDALMKQLLQTAIKAIEFNASTTLDGKHGDKIPLQELVEKAASSINPFSKT